MSGVYHPMAVLLWCDHDTPPEDEMKALVVLAEVIGDSERAYRLAKGTDEESRWPWNGVAARPVTRDAGELMVRWLATGGIRAVVDHGYYSDHHDEGWDVSQVWADAEKQG